MGYSKPFLSVPSLGKEIVVKAEGEEKQNDAVKFDLMVHDFIWIRFQTHLWQEILSYCLCPSEITHCLF